MFSTRRSAAGTCGIVAAGFSGLLLLSIPPSLPVVSAAPQTTLPETALWLLPSKPSVLASGLSDAVRSLAEGDAAGTLSAFTRASADPVLGGYARLYRGRAELALKRYDAAAASARAVIDTVPAGYLGEAALWLLADASEGAAQWENAVRALEALAKLDSSNGALAQLRLARAALKVKDAVTAARAFAAVYYDFPLSDEARAASDELRRLVTVPARESLPRDLARAQRLFSGRRYPEARQAFADLRGLTQGAERAIVDLRLAESDFYLKKYAAARHALRAHGERWSAHRAEAGYFQLGALRGLGNAAAYIADTHTYVDAYPDQPFAEAALNDLGTYFILANDDGKAAGVFAEMYRRFPAGAFADRAAWKAGWWAYRGGDLRRAITLFESAARSMPRADFRPPWLYWAARAHDRLGERDAARLGYQQVIADYRNSYYGRLASRRLASLGPASPPRAAAALPASTWPAIAPGTAPANAPLIRALIGAGLYDDAVFELRRVQKQSGSSPFLEASIANALNRKGELRPAITAMRRAYPQFMGQGGERLPGSILRVIFPLDYWPLLRQHATARKLDPFVVVALVAQESTFQSDVRSAADAWGLMQIIPGTGRVYAAKLGIRPFSTSRLTTPEINVRIGTTYLAELIAQFGELAHAIAAYNAGENRIARWRTERPGVDVDEFIDDIPFPETQNYVKRILGTAEDYRTLYGDESRP